MREPAHVVFQAAKVVLHRLNAAIHGSETLVHCVKAAVHPLVERDDRIGNLLLKAPKFLAEVRTNDFGGLL